MATITVNKQGEGEFEVTVAAGSTTTHVVTLTDAYYEKLTGGAVAADELVSKSFEFLLERESNTMILSRFELPVISQYFPEFEKTIKSRI